jgi:hypothetical protein
MRQLLIVPMFLILSTAVCQFRVTPAIKKYELPVIPSKPISPSPLGLQPDEQSVYTYQSPSLTSLPASSQNQSQAFWINNITSLSYNNGKFGTYYYWDLQGNLRGTRGFIDLSGKSKLGIKLLFPWH